MTRDAVVRCPGCGREVLVNSDGRMRKHREAAKKTRCSWADEHPYEEELVVCVARASYDAKRMEETLLNVEKLLCGRLDESDLSRSIWKHRCGLAGALAEAEKVAERKRSER